MKILLLFYYNKEKWDNLLTNYGTNEYLYNHQGQRTRKITNTDNIMYYYDGSKLLGENRVKESGTLGTQNIRYIYDMLGITGVRYTKGSQTIDYQYAKDGQGNVIAVLKDGQPIVEYYYDAYGNCDEVILNQNDPFASINPIRWKSQYYDLETKMYYINARYYDPEVYQYLDSLDIERIIESMDTIGGLNLHAICTDNPIDLDINRYNILTVTELFPDPYYDASNGYKQSKWAKIRYKVFKIFLIVTVVLMLNPATQGFGIALMIAGIKAGISGAIIGGLIGGLISKAMGGKFFKAFADGFIAGFVDGFIAGQITFCLSSFISSIMNDIEAANGICPKQGQCFIAGTLVLTEHGHKIIEDIKIGDKVWAYDEETGENELKEVVHLFRNESCMKTTLSIASGNGVIDEITSTPGHKYYLPDNKINRNPNEVLEHESYNGLTNEWVSACDLKKGDRVLLSDGQYGIITGTKTESCEPFVTYNFEVADFHTYYVGMNGICVHNNGCTYDIDKLVKTQPKELLNETSISNNIELIQSGADVRVPIRVHKGTAYVVDGHHRLEAFARLGYQRVPVTYVHASQLGRAPYYRTLADILAGSIFHY